ncbi:glycoside hydrolase family 3 C-terminal domain-containing protein [Schaalia sp. 19OD2882]|uniref:glycoside hydrolase family 3 protein n=1 Tax=Schaalia sp. 19OD2882 TaxID=2794089 RepID=UPI001C1ECB64|nr:glycoside hydrolase family 3 protein [Schaalia sp. 19OD2882]QWW19277.1 glycoside hydrolase family 3 C-terminal domain-containing protein [Schaalia sp. 19OD2882]
MLEIEWSDVLAMVESLQVPLIVLGVALVLALVVTIAARGRVPRTRKFVRSTTWIAMMLVAVVSVMSMLYGGLRNTLNLASGDGVLSDATVAHMNDLGASIAEEGMVLLKNEGGALPLEKGSAVNTFGWASTNPVYGGTGSGAMSENHDKVTLLEGLQEAGFQTNQALIDFYTTYRSDRPDIAIAIAKAEWTLPEPAAASYPQKLLTSVQSHSKTSIVTISRSGGEGFDLPWDMVGQIEEQPAYSYKENSTQYKDFEAGQGYLSLSRSERDMIDLAKKNSETVIVVYNGANVFELGDLEADPQIDAIVWAIPPGQVGFKALGKILDGEVNPSARTTDTFVADTTKTPTSKNFGSFMYTNLSQHDYTHPVRKTLQRASFVNYVEGIYVGYRWYETAAVEGAIDYDKEVVYPFGHGLSYTTFEQTMGDLERADGKVSVEVTVTNTGTVAGKDVVEIYHTPPYTNGGIEKSAVNLLAFDKTEKLEPGASETLTLSWDEGDMASYDDRRAKAWVLEAGRYVISLRSDSHTVIVGKDLDLARTITYDSADRTHNGDKVAATNHFDRARGEFTYLSRADHFANAAAATAAPTDFALPEEYVDSFYSQVNYDPKKFDKDSDTMPTTGAAGEIVLADLHGAAWEDPKWDQLLDRLTVEEMNELIANGGYQTTAVPSIGKVQNLDVDGPMALKNNFTGVGSIALPVEMAVAASFNVDIADQYGKAIVVMAKEMGVSGWYAPAMNLHRNPYSGRNFEYNSEDPVLSARIAATMVKAVQDEGVYAYIKHFALNEQENGRNFKLATWASEQSMRELYFVPFEESVKDGGATAVMSAFNYIGNTYAGAMPELLNTVLRDEWGFRGTVLTDYFGTYGYQMADQSIRGGNDLMLATVKTTNYVTDFSATSVIAMRTACHNILYTAANSWVYEKGTPDDPMLLWEWIAWIGAAVLTLVAVAPFVVALRRFRGRARTLAVDSGRKA